MHQDKPLLPELRDIALQILALVADMIGRIAVFPYPPHDGGVILQGGDQLDHDPRCVGKKADLYLTPEILGFLSAGSIPQGLELFCGGGKILNRISDMVYAHELPPGTAA